jgi:hypothetical protein
LSPFFKKNEYYNAYRFIGKHGITSYPFVASLTYKQLPISILYDENLPYIEYNGRKLYFPKQYLEQDIRNLYRSLRIEQDDDSAHRYVKSYDELEGKILLDIGAAEGIFALDAVDYVKKIYLFECEEQWMEPLQATFRPWRKKVEIIKKYVSDTDTSDSITIDSFMNGKEHDNIHIKMDIEGAEQSALLGAKELLTNGKSISFSICTYHKEEDAQKICLFFELLGWGGYYFEFTQGYLCYDFTLRKAICRGRNCI